MRLVEAFASIQGESTHAGRPSFFLRLAGCNLDCSYCDTRYAQNAEAGRETSIDELVALTRNSGLNLVEITGGEPLATPETPELCRRLLAEGFEVMIETNGSLPISPLPREVRKILDCKLPSSGMAAQNLTSNYPLLQSHDEVKFVTGSRKDFDYALNIIQTHRLPEKTRNLLASPVWNTLPPQTLAAWILESQAPLRLQLPPYGLCAGT